MENGARCQDGEGIGNEETHERATADAVDILWCTNGELGKRTHSGKSYLSCGEHNCTKLCLVAHFGKEDNRENLEKEENLLAK